MADETPGVIDFNDDNRVTIIVENSQTSVSFSKPEAQSTKDVMELLRLRYKGAFAISDDNTTITKRFIVDGDYVSAISAAIMQQFSQQSHNPPGLSVNRVIAGALSNKWTR